MIMVNCEEVHHVVSPDVVVDGGEEEVEKVRDTRSGPHAMKVFKANVQAVGLALQAGAIEEENVLAPEVPVAKHSEAIARAHEGRLHFV